MITRTRSGSTDLGFVVEGTMPEFGFGPAGWTDGILMGRLRDGAGPV